MRFLILALTAIGYLSFGIVESDAARQRKQRGRAAATKKSGRKNGATKGSKSRSKSKGKGKGRSRGRSGSGSGSSGSFTVRELTEIKQLRLDSGIVYYQYKTNGARPIIAHVVECNRKISGNAIRLIKGEDHAAGLERLKDMSHRFDNLTNHVVYGMVNGNFWRAVSNVMVGPCVIDGEVVQMAGYKSWSSAFFDVNNAMKIDRFNLSGKVFIQGREMSIESVNTREGNGVVLYNRYGGSVVPYLNQKQIERAFQEAVRDSSTDVNDSTEAELTEDMLRAEILKKKRERDNEFPMIKIRVRYLRTPSVNTTTACEVLGVDSGAVNMPIRGAIISLPKSALAGKVPKLRDTVKIRFETNVMNQTKFMNAVCGTPRLVRAGVAKSEAAKEGSTGERFVSHALARTGIGVSQDGEKLYIVAVPPDRSDAGTQGASLQQMAQIMSLAGCYEAMNLDGGGSTGMTVRNDHVFYDGQDPLTRKVGLGVAVVKLAKILRTTGY